MIESSKFRSTVKKSTDQLMYYVVLYMQITEEQVIMGSLGMGWATPSEIHTPPV